MLILLSWQYLYVEVQRGLQSLTFYDFIKPFVLQVDANVLVDSNEQNQNIRETDL